MISSSSYVFAVLLGMASVRADPLVVMGLTEPLCDVLLSTSVPGVVQVWHCREGDFVEVGAVILELDNQLEQLEVERRRLTVDHRKSDWEALRRLNDQSSLSVRKEELQRAETEYRIAAVDHEMAIERLRKRSIIAPCAGYVSEIGRDPGEAAQEYQPIARLVDTRACYWVGHVPARAADRLRLDGDVRLEIEGAAGPVVLGGKVVFLSPVVDPASGLRKVKVLFDNQDARVLPGVAGRLVVDR